MKTKLVTQATQHQKMLDTSSKTHEENELNNLVHDMKSNEASNINNDEVDSQKLFLIVECGKKI